MTLLELGNVFLSTSRWFGSLQNLGRLDGFDFEIPGGSRLLERGSKIERLSIQAHGDLLLARRLDHLSRLGRRQVRSLEPLGPSLLMGLSCILFLLKLWLRWSLSKR